MTVKTFFVNMLVLVISFQSKNILAKEFCNSELFKPNCLSKEVIQVLYAVYGRKEFGRCLKKDDEYDKYLSKLPGYINCYSDVKNIIEPHCAGNQSCEIYVSSIETETNCSKTLLKYLDASYRCIGGEPFFSYLQFYFFID